MRVLLPALFCLISWTLSAQQDTLTTVETDTLIQDTTRTHSWKKAMLFSAVVPGAGQVYNHIAMPRGKKKAYWKVPLIYAGLGLTTYFAINNNQQKNLVRREIEYRIATGSYNNFQEYDQTALETLYVQYRNRRDFAIVGIGLVYLINIIDAGVEAHFVNFDISEDLSLHIQPTVLNYQTPGLRLAFNFR